MKYAVYVVMVEDTNEAFEEMALSVDSWEAVETNIGSSDDAEKLLRDIATAVGSDEWPR
jgi:hypothetical protein